MQRLIENNAMDKNSYSLNEMFTDMQNGIWKELDTKKPVDAFRRNLQTVYIERMADILGQKTPLPSLGSFLSIITPNPTEPVKSDIFSEVKASLRSLQLKVRAALVTTTDKATKNHLMDVADRIKAILEPK
jgi:Zn-dependent M32 family carboxypeptidase